MSNRAGVNNVTCPFCDSHNLRKSRRANARLAFPLSLIAIWVRCRCCGRRFLRFGLLPGRTLPDASPRCRRAA